MKRCLIVFLLICLFQGVTAQTVTLNTLPKNLKGIRMNFKVDFSHALIQGMSEEQYAEYEKDWQDDKSTIVNNFRKATNLALGKSYGVGDYKNSPFTVNVKVNTITDNGFFICDVDIIDENDKVVFHLDYLTGGKEPSIGIGTKLARMKLWATLTGKALGSILKKEFSQK